MRKKALALVLGVAFVLVLAALTFPLGQPGCSGADCFPIPIGATPGPGKSSFASILMIFPGSIQYTDGTSNSLTSQTTVFSVVFGGNNKNVSQVTASVQVRSTATSNITVSVSGFVDEVASRSRTNPAGGYYKQLSRKTVSGSFSIGPSLSTFYVTNISHPQGDFATYSDIGAGTSAQYNYALVGFLNFTLGAPISKTVPVVFSWPNLPLTITASSSPPPPPPPPPGPPPPGGGGCSSARGVYCLAVLGPPGGVKYSWYVLGVAAPPPPLVTTPASSKDILINLGLY